MNAKWFLLIIILASVLGSLFLPQQCPNGERQFLYAECDASETCGDKEDWKTSVVCLPSGLELDKPIITGLAKGGFVILAEVPVSYER